MVIVVGGGLVGFLVVYFIYFVGGNVYVFDKQGFFGGNFIKVIFGINGVFICIQVDFGIKDFVKQFYDDIFKFVCDKVRFDFIKVFIYKFVVVVEWFQDVFNFDFIFVFCFG